MMMRVFMTVMCLGLLPAGLAPAARAEVVVFAAASLKEPLDALADAAGDVVVSYGGSGTMARQVSLGAPADVVVLANTDWMDVLVAGGHVQAETVRDVAGNALVLIGPADMDDVPLTQSGVLAALDGGRLALGLTGAVPAGIYAKAALTDLGLWAALSGQLAEVDNVRAALALVARGQAPLGLVYATDARVSDAVRVVATVPQDSHPAIRYQAALVTGAQGPAAAFLARLAGPEGQAALARAGFLAVGP